MQSNAAYSQSASTAITSFFENIAPQRSATLPSCATPITHVLKGETLTFDTTSTQKLNHEASLRNHARIQYASGSFVSKYESQLVALAERNLLDPCHFNALTNAHTPIDAINALGDALDEPAARLVDAGNRTVDEVKNILKPLNLSVQTANTLFNHPLMDFLVQEGEHYERSDPTWSVSNGGELEALLCPIGDLKKALPKHNKALFAPLSKVLNTLLCTLSGFGLAIHSSELGEGLMYESLTPSSYGKTMLDMLHVYLFECPEDDQKQILLRSILSEVNAQEELWIIEDLFYMHIDGEYSDIESIIGAAFGEGGYSLQCAIQETFNRAYVGIRWGGGELFSPTDGCVFTQMAQALSQLPKRHPLVSNLYALVQVLSDNKALLESDLKMEYDEEVMIRCSGFVAPCSQYEFENLGVYEIINDLYRYGMETGELGDRFLFTPESFECANAAESFKGTLLANAALIYVCLVVTDYIEQAAKKVA
ncbi:hypothetical protein [Aliidiomarina quisquiliarum]|uniref:hypothetical protein n=1 Tax=Aliidiomarina quisquiliarum TaxID=2938947 RepID=UPI00208ED3E1|nr:hypothetical protein [Aliidiomarina quisquiliarum]MCO4319982.1 hypothetical protein [Aliidiomarina quisquiliarum]